MFVRRGTACIAATAVFILTACAAHRACGADADAFAVAASKPVASNPEGVVCSLKTGGDGRFQVGERIPISVSFTSDRPGYQVYTHTGAIFGFGSDTFQVDAAKGTRILPIPKFGGYSGPAPARETLSAEPMSLGLNLNDFVQFDRPGVYRVYVVSSRVTSGGQPFSPGLPVASAPVPVTILPQDPAWAAGKVTEAKRVLDADPQPMIEAARFEAASVLRYLGTRDAAKEMLAVVSGDREPRSNPLITMTCIKGLKEFPDKPWLISEMERDIAEPDFTVNQYFLTALAWIEVGQTGDANDTPDLKLTQDYRRVMTRLWLATEAALPFKSQAATPMTVHSLLELAWLDWDLKNTAGFHQKLPALARKLPQIFDKLPRLAQSYVVSTQADWPYAGGKAMLAPLLAAWPRIAPPYNNDYEYPDLVLRRIYELSPSEGRKLALAEMASDHPRVDEVTLCILPDKSLPQLDHVFAARLANNYISGADVLCRMIARYATKAILPQVKARYSIPDTDWSCDPQASLFAYFLRVDPDYGVAMVKKALENRKNTGCYQFLFSDIARRGYSPKLIPIARQHVNDPDPQVARDAAKLIRTYSAR